MRRGTSMHRQLHKTSYTPVFFGTCQGTAAVRSGSPSLSLTGRHSSGAVMALCKLILLWLSHQLQREWSFLPCRNRRTSWWMIAAEEKGKTLSSVEDSGKWANFGLPFLPWLGFLVVSSAMESTFEICSSFIYLCCLPKCQAAGGLSTTPEAGPWRMCLEMFTCTFIYETVPVIVSKHLWIYSYL